MGSRWISGSRNRSRRVNSDSTAEICYLREAGNGSISFTFWLLINFIEEWSNLWVINSISIMCHIWHCVRVQNSKWPIEIPIQSEQLYQMIPNSFNQFMNFSTTQHRSFVMKLSEHNGRQSEFQFNWRNFWFRIISFPQELYR